MTNIIKKNKWILFRMIFYIFILAYLFTARETFADKSFRVLYSDLYLIAIAAFFGLLLIFSFQYFFNKYYRRKWMWPTWKKCPFNVKEPLQTFCCFGEIVFGIGFMFLFSTKKITPFFLSFVILGISLIAAVYLFGLFLNFINKSI